MVDSGQKWCYNDFTDLLMVDFMSLLTGAYSHAVDDKKRIRIPAKFKADLCGETVEDDGNEQKKFSLVFQTGTDGCICVYTQKTVDEITAPFLAVKKSDPVKYKAVRLYLNTFETIESDNQGRFVLPSRFREHAQIKKELMICGMGDHVEIWAKEVYDEYFNSEKLDINELVKILEI